jgi:sigma-B regulation protein RsbU (phosphoserine phosphatase)
MRDSPIILQVGHSPECAVHLRNSGFQVTHLHSLPDAVTAVAEGKFAAAIFDLELPEAGGLDAFRSFVEAAPDLPLVVLMDQWQAVNPAEVIAAGAQDCLEKNHLAIPALAQALRNAVARHECQQAMSKDRMLLRTLMRHIPDSIYFKDTESRFLMMSESQSKKFHLDDVAKAIGKNDHDFFSGPHADQAFRDEQEIIRTGQPLVGIEEKETWPDGHETWVSTTKMPLCDARGRIVGTFGVSRDITERKLMQDALARRTRELEQKNQQIAEELKMARELQLAMLPQEFPSFLNGNRSAGDSALEFFSFYHPTGAVSGDFFNVAALSDTKVGVFICDVMGHDVRAALVTAMLRAQVQDLSAAAVEPGQLLAQMNHNLHSVFKQIGATMYATAFYLVADVACGEILYASAGHPEPLQVRRQAGQVERLAGNGAVGRAKGPALGLFSEAPFPTHRRGLEAGDLIALYTDGLVEINSPDQQFFTTELLMNSVQRRAQLPTADLLKGVIADIHEFSGQPEFEDDVCLVGMEVKRLG